MGIDYVVDLACEPKRSASTREIVSMLKAEGRARMLLQFADDNGDDRPAEQLRFSMITRTPAGSEEIETSAQDMLDTARPLEELAHHCAGCRANLSGGLREGAFGCHGHIPYPVSRTAETWLLSLFPASLDSPAGEFLARAIADFGYDGSHTAQLRSQGMFFEASSPAARRWPNGFELTSDQAWEMIFGVGDLQPAHATMLCVMVGVLPHDLPVEDLKRALSDPARRRALLATTALPPEPPEGSGGLQRFLDAMRTSAALDVPLVVDG